MRQRFRVLGSLVEISGPEDAIAPIAATYARFRAPRSSEESPDCFIRCLENEGVIRSGTADIPLLPGLPPTMQLYQQFLTAILDRVAGHIILHAAALETKSGEGVLLAAPSGHGKSSLTQELVQRGCRFLSDDYAPLDPAAALIAPYPRTIGIQPGGGAPVPRPVREAASSGTAPVLLGKAQIDPGLIRGEDGVASRPVPLRHVLLLTASTVSPDELQAWDRRTDLNVACDARHGERIDAIFRHTPGVTILTRTGGGEGYCRSWRLSLDAKLHPGGALAEVLEDPAMILVEKVWSDPPGFDTAPKACPVPRRSAAAILGREVLNRRRGGALMKRYKGDTTLLFLDIAGALNGASCHQVQVGRFGNTVDLIDSLIGPANRV